MYNLAIIKCTCLPLLAPRLKNFQIKIYYPAGDWTPAESEADKLPCEPERRALVILDMEEGDWTRFFRKFTNRESKFCNAGLFSRIMSSDMEEVDFSGWVKTGFLCQGFGGGGERTGFEDSAGNSKEWWEAGWILSLRLQEIIAFRAIIWRSNMASCTVSTFRGSISFRALPGIVELCTKPALPG